MTKEKIILEQGMLERRNLSHPFSKPEVKEKFILYLSQIRESYFHGASDASVMAREADGPMQSRHDTTKTEQAWLANALNVMGENLDKRIIDWEVMFPDQATDKAGLGSLMLLEDLKYDDKEWFYMVPFGGGISISIKGENIIGISIESALGKNLLGKKRGQEIEYVVHPDDTNPQKFKILEIL